MASDLVSRMVSLVERGHSPGKVLESSLNYGPGSSVKVNKATTGKDPQTGGSISIPEGTVVSILGIGGGNSLELVADLLFLLQVMMKVQSRLVVKKFSLN